MGQGKHELTSILLIGSSGKIGLTLATKLRMAGRRIVGLDVSPTSAALLDHFIQADIEEPSAFSALSNYHFDAIIIATPEAVSGAAVRNIVVPYGGGSLVIDFLSEKYSFAQLMTNEAVDSEYIGVHPLFAPSVGWQGQNVLINPKDIRTTRAQGFISLLKEWGAVIHYCDALEHDQLMSYVQVAPHAILIAYAQFLVARSVDLQLLGKVSTPASRVIWSMLARMIENDPSVYWEIQAHNVTGQEVRDELAGFLTSLNELIRTDDKKSFDLTFLKLRDLFAGDLATYQSLADKIAGSHSLGTERPPETAPTPP